MRKLQTFTLENQKNERKGWRGGLAVLDFIIYTVIIGAILAVLFFVLKPTATNAVEANAIKNEYSAIQTGLQQYYSDVHKYPKSGWTWNQDNAYVPEDVVNHGWNYECSNNQITLTTPEINNPKILVKAFNNLNKVVKDENPNASVAKNGNKLVVTLPDKVCE
jgi:type II secretory pathway pseudopilin PulG